MLSDVGSILNLIMHGSFKSGFGDPKYNELAQGDETFEVSYRSRYVSFPSSNINYCSILMASYRLDV